MNWIVPQIAAVFSRKAVWTTLDPNLVVIQYVGDVSTAVSGLNNFVSCDVVQDTPEEIVIEETPKQEMVAEASNEEATPDVAKEPEVDKSHEVVDDLPPEQAQKLQEVKASNMFFIK